MPPPASVSGASLARWLYTFPCLFHLLESVLARLSSLVPLDKFGRCYGLAILVLERRDGVEPYELRWQEVEFTVTYRALFVRYLQNGLSDRDASPKHSRM